MHPELIKAELKVAGWTQAELARELDVSPSFVSSVIHGRSRSARVQRTIAGLIGRRQAQVFPEPKDAGPSPEERAEMVRVASAA